MKITRRQLGRIIKEAVRLAERYDDDFDMPLPPREALPREYHAMEDLDLYNDPYGADKDPSWDDSGDSGDWDDAPHERRRLTRNSWD